MASKHERGRLGAAAFIQQTPGQSASVLTALHVSSYLGGSSQWRGLGLINSGTSIGSVAANVVSGDAIIIRPYMASFLASSMGPVNLFVASVSPGFFHVQTIGSLSVVRPLPFAWSVLK